MRRIDAEFFIRFPEGRCQGAVVAIVDTAADWIEALWPRAGRAPIPVMIYGDEDYGSAAPRRLEP